MIKSNSLQLINLTQHTCIYLLHQINCLIGCSVAWVDIMRPREGARRNNPECMHAPIVWGPAMRIFIYGPVPSHATMWDDCDEGNTPYEPFGFLHVLYMCILFAAMDMYTYG